MSTHLTADIRNVALAGHRASGKTSLADALLYKAQAVDRRGSVDDMTSAPTATTKNTTITSPSTPASSISKTTASAST